MIPIRDTAPCHSKPIVSWTLIGLCVAIFVTMELIPEPWKYKLTYWFGLVPIRYSSPAWAASFGLPHDYFLSFVTSLFLHGGWLHLLVNMLFMWIFADNVEDRMGKSRFLFFYLICGLSAQALQWYFDPYLTIPVVGASGAIAGVLGAYFFLYPYERVIVVIPIIFFPLVFHVPAIAFLGFWIIIQLQKATTSVMFEGVMADVAWWAHLGGFIAGSLLYRFFLKDEPE